MEELNKTQIVLLGLLVSFVTSIGTGIITVSLLSQAPTEVTQTINRVVERTVEKVIPQTTGVNTVTKETTVVVKEEDLVIDSINKNAKSIIRILTNTSEATFLSIGFVVSKEGVALAPAKDLVSGVMYVASFSDGKSFPVKVTSVDSKTNIATLNIQKDTANSSYALVPAVFANSDTTKLGQTVIAVGGKTDNTVAIGRVTSLKKETGGTQGATSTPIAFIETDITSSKGEISGTPLINLAGEIVGLKVWIGDTQKEGEYVAINTIKI